MTAIKNLEILAEQQATLAEQFAEFRSAYQAATEEDKASLAKTLDSIQAKMAEVEKTIADNEEHIVPGAEPFNPETGKGFSIARACNALRVGDWSNAEYEQDVIRTMGSQVDASGGFLVPENLAPGLIELLQARSVFTSAQGITEMPGNGHMPFNRIAAGVTPEAVASEGSSITASDLTIEQFTLTPKTIAARIKVANQLMEMSPVAAETFITMQASKDLALLRDQYILRGTGSSGQPLGLLNDPDIGSFAVSATPTYQELLGALEDIAVANAYVPSCAWWMHPTQRTLVQMAPGATNVDVERRALTSGLPQALLGHAFHLTTQFSATSDANSMVFGDPACILVANFKGLEVRVSDVADDAFQKDETHVRLIQRFDTHRIQPSAFTVAS
jgi:HK97 family phage major capsid protein